MTQPTLALDLATCTGWAMRDEKGQCHSGAWKLGDSSDPGGRYLTLWEHIEGLRLAHGMPRLVAEKPIIYKGRPSGARVAFGLLATVQLFGRLHDQRVTEIDPNVVKKAVTGNGGAGKPVVLLAVQGLYPDQRVGSFDQADALAVLYTFEGQQ